MKHYLLLAINLILESFGSGLEWEYYQKEVKIWNGWTENYDSSVKLYCRKNVYSGNHYYRTMMCGCNGIDPNTWDLFDGEDLELYKGNPKC